MQFKLGQWYKNRSGDIARVISVKQFIDKDNVYTLEFSTGHICFETRNGNVFTHIPGCTGYNWKPLEIPEGYRKLEIGEVPVAGDLWSIDGAEKFNELPPESWIVETKTPIPPMEKRVVGTSGFGMYDPGAIWARKVEKWVPYTFDNCPAIIKVISKHNGRKYAAYLRCDKYVSVFNGYLTFKEFFEEYTDLNGGPLGTKV